MWFEMPYTLGPVTRKDRITGIAGALSTSNDTAHQPLTSSRASSKKGEERTDTFRVVRAHLELNADAGAHPQRANSERSTRLDQPKHESSTPKVDLDRLGSGQSLKLAASRARPPAESPRLNANGRVESSMPATIVAPVGRDNIRNSVDRGASSADLSSGLHVLVVDDDKSVPGNRPVTSPDLGSRLTRMMMARMLVRLGHEVNTAENGQQALALITDAFQLKADAKPVDVVFLDK